MKTRRLRVVLSLLVLALALLACVAEPLDVDPGDGGGEANEQPADTDEDQVADGQGEEPDDERDPVEEAELEDEVEPAPVAEMFFTVSGTVYYDGDGDSRFSDTGSDALYEGATVVLVDADTGEVLDSQDTGSDGRYQFDLLENRGDVVVVVTPKDDLVFGAPVEAGPDELPSGVDADGRSMSLAVVLDSGEVVNAAVQEPPMTGGALFATEAGLLEVTTIVCDTGEPGDTSGLAWANTTYDLAADSQGVSVSLDAAALPEDHPIFVGIDVKGEGTPLAPQRDDLALTPATYAASVAIQDADMLGTSAMTALQDDVTVTIPAAVSVDVVDDQIVVTFFTSNFQGDLTLVRFTISDGELCTLSGPLEDEGGYLPVTNFGSGIAAFFEARDTQPFYDTRNGTGLLMPIDLNPQRTGDATFDIVIGDATVRGQVDVLSGGSDDRIGQFSETYAMEPGSDIDTSTLPWVTRVLNYPDQPRGIASFADNGSATTPVAFTISLLGDAPLTQEQVNLASDTLALLAETFRSQYQLVD